MIADVLGALAMVLAVAGPPNVAVATGEPDWEVGRERIVVALSDAGIEPVASGAAGYRSLAEVRASCRDDVYEVEVRLRNWAGDVYRTERVTGRGCSDAAQAELGRAVGEVVVLHIRESCRDRPCTPPAKPSQPKRMPWSLRAGAGLLPVAGGLSGGPTGALQLGAERHLNDKVAIDLDTQTTVVPSTHGDRNAWMGYVIGRAHVLGTLGPNRLKLHLGVGAGALWVWTSDPRARINGRQHVATMGVMSFIGRVSFQLNDAWSVYVGSGVAAVMPSPTLAHDGDAWRTFHGPLIDANLGLRWRPPALRGR